MKSRILSSLIALVATAHLSSAQAEVKVGDTAPDFALQASDGKTYKLSDFKGKKAVVVAWFPKAFTGGCTKECTNMREEGAKLRKYEVAYFTASVDPIQLNTDFAKSLNLDYPILSDPNKEAAKAYGVLNPKRPFANRWTFYIGKNGKILHIDKQVKPTSHASDIATQLEKLGVAKAH